MVRSNSGLNDFAQNTLETEASPMPQRCLLHETLHPIMLVRKARVLMIDFGSDEVSSLSKVAGILSVNWEVCVQKCSCLCLSSFYLSIIFMCMSAVATCICVHCVQTVSVEARRQHQVSGTRFLLSWEPTYTGWGSLGPLLSILL